MNGINTWTLYPMYTPPTQLPRASWDKPNGTSQKTIRKRARYIRSQHRKRK